MEKYLGQLQELVVFYGLQILAAIAIFVVGRIAAGIIRNALQRALRKSKVDETLISFVGNVAHVAVLVFTIIAALGQLGVATASFIAVVGAAGLAIGLALQGSLANFAAGVLMILFKPFKLGDYIEAGGAAGTVTGINIFTTELKTPDNKKVIIPNASVTGGSIVNFSANETRRLDLIASVSYSDDLDKVRRILEQILADEPRALKDPAPTIGLLALADSSVNFAVRPWVKREDYLPAMFSLQEAMKKRFDQEGISIPFPQQDLHVHTVTRAS